MEPLPYDPKRPRGRGAPLDAQQTSALLNIHVYNRFTDEPLVGAAISIINAAHLGGFNEPAAPLASRPQSGTSGRPQSAKNAGSAFNGNTVTNDAGWAYAEVLAAGYQYALTATCTGFRPFGSCEDEEVLVLPEPGDNLTFALGLVPSTPGTLVTVRLLHVAKPMGRQADPIAATGQRISIPEIYDRDGDVLRIDHAAVPLCVETGGLVVDHRLHRVGEYGTDKEGHTCFYGMEPANAVLARSPPRPARTSPLLVGNAPLVAWGAEPQADGSPETSADKDNDLERTSARLLQKLVPPSPPPEPLPPPALDKLQSYRRSYWLHNHIGIGSFRVSMGDPSLQIVAVATVSDTLQTVDPRSVMVLPVLDDGYAPLEIYAASMPTVGANANRYMYDAREVVGQAIFTDNTAGAFVARGGSRLPDTVQVYVRRRAFVDIVVYDMSDNTKDVGKECGFSYSVRRLTPGNALGPDEVPDLARGRLGDPNGPTTYMSPGFEYLVVVEVGAPYAPFTLRQQRLATWKQEPFVFHIPSRRLVDVTITIQEDTPGRPPLTGVGLIIKWAAEDRGLSAGDTPTSSRPTSAPLSPGRTLPDRLWLTTDAMGRAQLSLPGGSFIKVRADVFPGQYEPASTTFSARLNHSARQNLLMLLQSTQAHASFGGQVSPMRLRPSSSIVPGGRSLQPSSNGGHPGRPSSSPARSGGSPGQMVRKAWGAEAPPPSTPGGLVTNTAPTNLMNQQSALLLNQQSAVSFASSYQPPPLSGQQAHEVHQQGMNLSMGASVAALDGMMDRQERQVVPPNADALVRVYDAVTCEQIYGAAFSVAIRRKYRPIITTDGSGTLIVGGTCGTDTVRSGFNSDPLRGILVGDPQRSTFISEIQASNFVSSSAVTKILELDDKHTKAAAAATNAMMTQQERHNALQRRYTELELEYRKLASETHQGLTELREGLDLVREERNLDKDEDAEPQRSAKVRVLRDRFETFRTHVNTFIQQQRGVGKDLEGRHLQLMQYVEQQNQAVFATIDKLKAEDIEQIKSIAASAQTDSLDTIKQTLDNLEQSKANITDLNENIANAVRVMQATQDKSIAEIKAVLPGNDFFSKIAAVIDERINGATDDMRRAVQDGAAPLDPASAGQVQNVVAIAMEEFKKQADAVQAALDGLVADKVQTGVVEALAQQAEQLKQLQLLNDKMMQAADSAAVAADKERTRLQGELEGLAARMDEEAQQVMAALPQGDVGANAEELAALDEHIRVVQEQRDALRAEYEAGLSVEQSSDTPNDRESKALAINSQLSNNISDAEAKASEAMAAIADAQSQHWPAESEEALAFEATVLDFAASIRQLAGSEIIDEGLSTSTPEEGEDEEARAQRQRLLIEANLTATVAAFQRAAAQEQDAITSLVGSTLDKAKDVEAKTQELEALQAKRRALENSGMAGSQALLAQAAAQLAKAAATPAPQGLSIEQLDILRGQVEEWAAQRLVNVSDQVDAVQQASKQVIDIRKEVESVVHEQVETLQTQLSALVKDCEDKVTAQQNALVRMQENAANNGDTSAMVEMLRQEVQGLVEDRLSGSAIVAALKATPDWVEPVSGEALEGKLRTKLEEQMRGMYVDLSRVLQKQIDKALGTRAAQGDGNGSQPADDAKSQMAPSDSGFLAARGGLDALSVEALRQEMRNMLAQERAAMLEEVKAVATSCCRCQQSSGDNQGAATPTSSSQARETAGLAWTLLYWGFTGAPSNSKRNVASLIPAEADVRVTLHLVHPYYEDQQHLEMTYAEWQATFTVEFAAIRDPDAAIFWQRRDALFQQFCNQSSGLLHLPLHQLARLQPENRVPPGNEMCRERVSTAEIQRRREVVSSAAGVIGIALTSNSGTFLSPPLSARPDPQQAGMLPAAYLSSNSGTWTVPSTGQLANFSSLSQLLEACGAVRHGFEAVQTCITCQQAAEPLVPVPAGGWTLPPSDTGSSGMSTPVASARPAWMNSSAGQAVQAIQFQSQRVRKLHLAAGWVLEHVASGGGEIPADVDVFTWCLSSGQVVHLRQLVRGYAEAVFLMDRVAAKLEELQKRIRAAQKQTQGSAGASNDSGAYAPVPPALQVLLDRRTVLAGQLGELQAFERELGFKLGPRGSFLAASTSEADVLAATPAPPSPRLQSARSSRSMSPMPPKQRFADVR